LRSTRFPARETPIVEFVVNLPYCFTILLISINKNPIKRANKGLQAVCQGNNMKIYYAFKRKAINFCLSRLKSDGATHMADALLYAADETRM
jgi:uncharacterized protein YegL